MCEQWGEFTTIVAATWGANTTGENERTEHFLWNVYLGAQGYVPSAAQMQPQTDALNTASAQGEEAVITKAKELARAQIEATAYTARNRTDSEYVTDLYEVFWQRAPDATELSRWMSKVTNWPAAHDYGLIYDWSLKVALLLKEIAMISGLCRV